MAASKGFVVDYIKSVQYPGLKAYFTEEGYMDGFT